MNGQLRVALVGAGGIGQAYAEASGAVAEVRLAAIVDVRPAGAQRLAEVHRVPYVADSFTIMDRERIDLAVICTPPATHEGLSTGFLQAGIPVLCEKPLAPTSEAGHRMLAVGASNGASLTMASKFRFVPDVVRARAMVLSGVLGDVVSAEVAFCAPVDMTNRWNSAPEVSGGGVLIDNGTHGLDLIRFVLGPIESVFTAVSTSTPGMEVEDTAITLMRTVGGQLGSVTVSWATDRLTDRYLSVHGSKGSLEVGWRGSRLRIRSAASDEPFGEGYNKLQALGDNLRNVARAQMGLEDLRETPLDAVASIDAIAAAYESVRTGGWVAVPSTEGGDAAP